MSNLVVAGRYVLQQSLGEGAQGEVWEAEDRLTGAIVAVKILRAGRSAESARVRREVSALRLLRIPGVVRLLDEGLDDGKPFLVMDRVEGLPFPGTPDRVWASMAHATMALVETLVRVHGAGVVHRDLKPANVLVNAAGVPIVLDFGLSASALLGAGLTQRGEMLGTPAYLAPEQIFGEATTPRTDLYALGVVLYEALSGVLPHATDNVRTLLLQRLSRRPRPLREVAPEVPPSIAGLVDLLLSRTPDDRPRSAGHVLALLRGQPAPVLEEPSLPRLGGDDVVQGLVGAARGGRAVDLVGPAGSGRTRALREATVTLERGGLSVVWLRPDRRPFASVGALVGDLDGIEDARLVDVIAHVGERIGAALAAGTVIIADDAEQLDAWSAAAIARGRAAGPILRAFLEPGAPDACPGALRLAPLDEAALRALFAGPDRLFHLRADAARALWERTEGRPARVVEELRAWLRAGLARHDRGLLAVDRDALAGLSAGVRLAPVDASGGGADAAALPRHLEELCAWVGAAWPSTQPDQLARAMALPVWRVEAEIDELCHSGALRVRPDGRVEAIHAGDDGWSPERRRAAHQALARALPEGAQGRLLHLIAAGEEDAHAIGRETSALASRLARAGQLDQAIAALAEGLLALRRAAPTDDRAVAEEGVLSTWVEIALADGTPQAHDRVLYELSRADPRATVANLEQLVRASLAFSVGGERAQVLASAITPFADPDLERRRQGVRVINARRGSLSQHEAALESLAAWASDSDDPLTRARYAGWLGRLRYRQARFDDAAQLHAEAAEGESWSTARVAARINAASALMEAFRLEEALSWAEAAREQAAACRHPFYEARAEWIARSAAYRMGRPMTVDLELVEAAALVGLADVEATVSMTEAAIAFRAHDRACAAALVARAARIWAGTGDGEPAVLMESLALACAENRASAPDVEKLAERARRCATPGLGLQALAFLAMAEGSSRPAWQDAAASLTAGIPPAFFHLRMDVLSADEALSLLGASVRDPSSRSAPGRR